jgi:hypothetical protein
VSRRKWAVFALGLASGALTAYLTARAAVSYILRLATTREES